MSRMQPSSPEYTVISGYLDQILELPWTEETQDTEKLSDCVEVLDADHYGLEKIKERITEYLAVLKLTGTMKAPIKRLQNKFRYQVLMRIKAGNKAILDKINQICLTYSNRKTSIVMEINSNNLT